MKNTPQPVAHGRCGKCGKPVSGFPGDYAKCACGHMQMLDARPPEGWRLVADAGRLAAMPFYNVLLFYASIVAIAWTQGGSGFAGGVVVVLVFATWIFSIMQFSKAAEKQRLWWIPVVEYHLSSLLLPACVVTGLSACNAIYQGAADGTRILAVLLAIIGLLVCVLTYGDARRRLAHLRIVPI